MRLLIVSLYWPPAGGPGVQRPLKLAGHLADLGLDVHVLAPDDPKWLHRDPAPAVHSALTVHRARNVGPRARRPAEELARARGLDRLALQAELGLRGLLVPDASVLWNLTAAPAAIRLVRRLRPDVVLTTSPPGSVHLAGLAAKRATGVRWVADLRDSLTQHAHRRREVRGEATLARLVARHADAIVCVSEAIAVETSALAPRGIPCMIGNGCDFEDFAGLPTLRGLGSGSPTPAASSGAATHARSWTPSRRPATTSRRASWAISEPVTATMRRAWASATGSSCCPMSPGARRSRCSGTPTRSCSSSRRPRAAAAACCRERCSSTSPPSGRSSPRCLPTARRRG